MSVPMHWLTLGRWDRLGLRHLIGYPLVLLLMLGCALESIGDILKQSTAATVPIGPFVDTATAATPYTAVIPYTCVRVYKNGAAPATKHDASTSIHGWQGMHRFALDTTDTGTLGRLTIQVYVSGKLQAWKDCTVVPANEFDSLVSGSDALEVDATLVEGADATDTIRDSVVDDATRIDASELNTLSGHDPGATIGTSSHAAADVWSVATRSLTILDEDSTTLDLDGTTIGTVTTLTGHTAQSGDSYARIGAAGVGLTAVALADATSDAVIADAVWNAATATYGAADTYGVLVETDLDAAGVRTALGMAAADLDTQLGAIPTVTEFNLRTLVTADYFVVGDYSAPLDAAGVRTALGMAAANLDTQLADLPTVAEFEARSIVSADYFVVGDLDTVPTCLLSTTVATAPDQTHLTLTAGADVDDTYKYALIVLYDASNSSYPSVRRVTAYTGATKTVTLNAAPDFTFEAADAVRIFVTRDTVITH